jgi:hypothetical protein
MNDIEREIQRIEEGEAWEDTDEVVEIDVKRPLNKVIPVRLSSEKWEELRREAHDVGVGPTTLARMWILEKLRQVMLTKKSA